MYPTPFRTCKGSTTDKLGHDGHGAHGLVHGLARSTNAGMMGMVLMGLCMDWPGVPLHARAGDGPSWTPARSVPRLAQRTLLFLCMQRAAGARMTALGRRARVAHDAG